MGGPDMAPHTQRSGHPGKAVAPVDLGVAVGSCDISWNFSA